jgi:hypothetical protein
MEHEIFRTSIANRLKDKNEARILYLRYHRILSQQKPQMSSCREERALLKLLNKAIRSLGRSEKNSELQISSYLSLIDNSPVFKPPLPK